MKPSFFAVLFILFHSACGFGQQAEFFVEKPVHKFPKTREGITLKHTYEITNTGDTPLIIFRYEVACSCTKVTLPGPIAPGLTGEITVEFDTNQKYYLQDRKIILHTNTKKKIHYLRFKAYIIPTDE